MPSQESSYASPDEADINPLLPQGESIETPMTQGPITSLAVDLMDRRSHERPEDFQTEPELQEDAENQLQKEISGGLGAGRFRWAASGPYSAWQSDAQPSERNGRGDLSLLCGLMPIILFLILNPEDLTSPSRRTLVLASIWLVVSVIAIVAGALGIREVAHHRASNMGVAITGLVLGSLFFLLLVAAYIWVMGILGT